MEVYSKSYLAHVVRTQGALFDDYARQHADCDTDHFIVSYMTGKTRAYIDEGQAYVATMNDIDLMNWFVTKESYQGKPGVSMKGFMPDWIGRFYALYQWEQRKSSAETIAEVPLDYLKCAYPGLHDLDLDLAVRKVAS